MPTQFTLVNKHTGVCELKLYPIKLLCENEYKSLEDNHTIQKNILQKIIYFNCEALVNLPTLFVIIFKVRLG